MSENADFAADMVAKMNINDKEVCEAVKSAKILVGKDPEKYQADFLKHKDLILALAGDFVDYSTKGFAEKDFRSMMQFLHNLCVHQKDFSRDLWIEHKDFISQALSFDYESSTLNVLSAIILQMTVNDVLVEEDHEVLNQLVKKLLILILKIDSNFPLLALKKVLILLKSKDFTVTYEGLEVDQKYLLLDILAEEKGEDLAIDTVIGLSGLFKSKARILLTVLSKKHASDPKETVKLLNLVCCLSHVENFQPHLQSDKSLLIDAIYLLRMIHDLGKEEEGGIFAPVNKIVDVAQKEKWESEPVFGFKRDLIRLIGNLCHNHKVNQDQVRENNGIELILDCSPIDGKNPYIQQWVIFSIRNLCHGNQENQALLYSINRKGTVDKNLLEKVGVEIKEM